MRSFAPLEDPAVLRVQPWRLSIVRLDAAMTLEEFARRYPGPVSLETLAILNGVEPGTRLARGSLVKRVVGEAIS